MTTTPTTDLDTEALRWRTEGSDADMLVDLYPEDTEILSVNDSIRVGRPGMAREREETSDVLREVRAREMAHLVEREVVGEERLAFDEVYENPDGVLAAVTMEVHDGGMFRQVAVEAWDE